MNTADQDESLNVFGEPLGSCSDRPLTGFFGTAVAIPVSLTLDPTQSVWRSPPFLEFSRFRGNDLSTPRPEFDFPGLKGRSLVFVCRTLAGGL